MAGDEPGGLDAQPRKHLQKPRAADLAREQAARDVVGRILAAVAAQPAGHGIHVDTEAAQNLLGHCRPPLSKSLERWCLPVMRVGRGRAVVLNHLHGQGPQELRQACMKLLLESVAVGHQEVKLEGSSAVSERLAWNGASKSCAEVLSFTQG